MSSEEAAVLAIVAAASKTDKEKWEWYRIADVLEDVGSALRLMEGEWDGFEPEAARALRNDALHGGATETLPSYQQLVEQVGSEGFELVPITDPRYPTNLRTIFNRPPFLFVEGSIEACVRRAVAVVGTRNATPDALDKAEEISTELAKEGIAIISGMALGIDAAAHRACIDAGGVTVAVAGTGIRNTYPAANATLKEEIARIGAVVSQFWPDAPPRPFHFPMRNIVTSGLSVATVVIEAGETSGARNQARRALEHGKQLFLLRSLVETQNWAERYSERPRTSVVDTAAEVVEGLSNVLSPPEQLSLA